MSKLLALTVAALMGSVTLASADSSFTLPQVQERDGIAELGRINADGDGVVELYALEAGRMGAMIGSEPIHEGTNSDVRVALANNTRQDAVAVLVVDGQTVATQDIRFND